MNAAIPWLLMAAISGAPVTATTLDGESLEGELLKLNAQQLVIEQGADNATVQIDQLMILQFTTAGSSPTVLDKAVRLVDQSVLGFDSLSASGEDATVSSATFGELTIPKSQITNIRWAGLDDKVSEAWEDLQTRNARDDLLVFRKGDVLDYVAGSVTRITGEGVTLSVQGRNLTAPLERVFGVIFANRKEQETPGLGLMRLANGDQLKMQELTLDEPGEVLSFATLGGVKLSIGIEQIREIDFGGGRIRFLADLPYDESGSVSPDPDFPVVWFTASNFPAGTGGRRPLTIGGETYQRGLWLHSGALVRLRLNRQFNEFRAIAGFDQTHVANMPRFDPRVKLVILGDGEELFSREFGWDDTPQKVNLDLSNVREMQIRVESLGAGKGILEHFALGDAQVIK